MRMLNKSSLWIITILFILSLTTGCAGNEQKGEAGNDGAGAPTEQAGEGLSGSVVIDGSSTVFPISEAIAEEFQAANPDVRVTVGVSGTSGGFKKFIPGESDINNASRKIKDAETAAVKENGFEAIEVPIAFDGITVVVNKENTWVDHLTVDELKKIWEPGSKVKLWSEVREGFPAEEIKLYGPGTDSGTFGYFTEAIMGEEGKSRPDYTASEDDHVLVQGVQNDKNSLGYFGFAYYTENQDKIKPVPIKATADAAAVEPTLETINNGSYTPLSRYLYLYASSKSLQEKPQVRAFMEFYLDHAAEMAELVGYVPLPPEEYEEGRKLIQ